MLVFLGCGVVGAEADSGTDAGVGISGNWDYDHPANGSDKRQWPGYCPAPFQ